MKTQQMLKLSMKSLLVCAMVVMVSTAYGKSKEDPSGNTDGIENAKVVYNMLDNHKGLAYDFSNVTTVSGCQEVTVNGFANSSFDGLQIWLIKQQHSERNIVLKNEADEYYIAERDVKPKIDVERLGKIMDANLKYPDFAAEIGEAGTVHVLFLIDEEGEIAKVVTDISEKYNSTNTCVAFREAAKRSVMATSGLWTPAKVNGKPVKKWMYVPVRFNLES